MGKQRGGGWRKKRNGLGARKCDSVVMGTDQEMEKTEGRENAQRRLCRSSVSWLGWGEWGIGHAATRPDGGGMGSVQGWPAGCGYWPGLKGQLGGREGVRRHNNKQRSVAGSTPTRDKHRVLPGYSISAAPSALYAVHGCT